MHSLTEACTERSSSKMALRLTTQPVVIVSIPRKMLFFHWNYPHLEVKGICCNYWGIVGINKRQVNFVNTSNIV